MVALRDRVRDHVSGKSRLQSTQEPRVGCRRLQNPRSRKGASLAATRRSTIPLAALM